jgi:hypothetical protein
MKRYILLVIAAAMILSCKKHSISPANIFGKWELARRYGGNINPLDTTYKAGNGNILEFHSDSSFKQYDNGTLTLDGKFHMQGNQLYFIVSYADQPLYETVSISGSQLTVKSPIPDVGTTVYDKISN